MHLLWSIGGVNYVLKAYDRLFFIILIILINKSIKPIYLLLDQVLLIILFSDEL